MKKRLDSKLFERVKQVSKHLTGKTYGIANVIGVNTLTFKGYCSEAREANLWPLLPSVLAAFPEISREWLYFAEGDMLGVESTSSAPLDSSEMHGKLRLHPGYHDDPLGRIEMLTNARGSSALELQEVFGVDLKVLKPFVARYDKARRAWDAWRAAGAREEDVPDVELPQIPDEWLDHFWRHYGPSPHWVLYGGGEHGWSALVRPRPGMAETERLRGEVAALREESERLRQESERLRQEYIAIREKKAGVEARLEVSLEDMKRLREESERLRQELTDVRDKNTRLEVSLEDMKRLREESERLRQELADVRDKSSRLEGKLEERQQSGTSQGDTVHSQTDATSMPHGRK